MMKLTVRTKNGSTESADNSSPRFPIERDMTKSSGGFHISNAGSAAAPRAKSGRRLAPLHLPCLVHKETETHHAV
ncbi:uncharacterized protein G2W53_021179 [Senna tora]|uniref:Uncharacterized protein n=1 Tax=Senna tora TaxID=362788 RepID=A0A834TJP9_9FABA|nr:uncharacterized protein G2W53_021179 [Senna tora]